MTEPLSSNILYFTETSSPSNQETSACAIASSSELIRRLRLKGFRVLEVRLVPSGSFLKAFVWGQLSSRVDSTELRLDLPRWLPRALLRLALLRVQKVHHLSRPQVWVDAEVPFSWCDDLSASRVVLALFSQGAPKDWRVQDGLSQEWLTQADLVLVPPERATPKLAKKVHALLPTLDFDQWSQARQIQNEPAALKGFTHPRVLVLALELTRQFIDVDAVRAAARARPDLQFLVWAQNPRHRDTSVEALLHEPNVRPCPVGLSAELLFHVQAALFAAPAMSRWNDEHRLLLLTMMAAGKPITMQLVDANREFARFVHGYDQPEMLLAKVERALKVGVEHDDWCIDLARARSADSQFIGLFG